MCAGNEPAQTVLSFNSHRLVSSQKAIVIALFDRENNYYREEDDDGKNVGMCYLYAVLEAYGSPRQFVDSTLQHCRIIREKKKND